MCGTSTTIRSAFIRQALNTGITSLRLQRVAKIGAPINEASLTSVAISEASADRVEVFMTGELPVPLNVIGRTLGCALTRNLQEA